MLCTATPRCFSHRLKSAAIRTCRFCQYRQYPCSFNDFANEMIWAASGPSSGRDRTTWLLITHFMMDSFPDYGLMEEVNTMSIRIHTTARETKLLPGYKT